MASIIKVNNVQNTAAGKNIINESGNTVTIGASGDTVTLAAGASQTGFGQTYSAVAWDTTAKTTTVTGVAGVGYFINTTGGAITANLPAGVAGDVIAFADYTRTFQTNNLTITPNGSEKIGGVVANFVAQTEGQSITLVYVDATEGWINTAESTGQSGLVPTFITATGGTITTVDTDYKVHTFTGPGTFTVCSVGNPVGSTTVDYMVIAGGGGGANANYGVPGGAGGAGGFREGYNPGSYTASPLATTALPVTATGFSITVGGGGGACTSGSNSIFSSITSAGGGGGGGGNSSGCASAGSSGGSGGGGGAGPQTPNSKPGGAGNTPPVSPSQGNTGGGAFSFQGHSFGSGAGGGATAAGSGGGPSTGGTGGAGATSSINATPTGRAGGGGGAGRQPLGGNGNPGPASDGGGAGGNAVGGQASGTTNTGGGGGGTACGGAGSGGSGIVIIRYKFQ